MMHFLSPTYFVNVKFVERVQLFAILLPKVIPGTW